jgi:hypothetical protein
VAVHQSVLTAAVMLPPANQLLGWNVQLVLAARGSVGF